MILKLLTDNGKGFNDSLDNPRRNCMILDNINEVKVKTYPETGEQALEVQYASPNRGLDSETFVLGYPAFLMNNSGKTIQTFHPHKPPLPVVERLGGIESVAVHSTNSCPART